MSLDAKATTRMALERIVIQHADGGSTDLGKPGTLNFRLRRKLYIWKNRKAFEREGLI